VVIFPQAFEPPASERLRLLKASATSLPFKDQSFDIVAAYQVLEHISEPKQALAEMLRVLKPGGMLCVVGPNLLSVSNSVQAIAKYAWQNRPVQRIFFRDAGMAKHPFGNTLPEAIVTLPINVLHLLRKTLASKASFIMRQPDRIPPFHADNDACYLCNPIDLQKWAKESNCTVIQNGKLGRSTGTASLAGGTWIAMRKN
jgi:SAM-dependent methyltransferase